MRGFGVLFAELKTEFRMSTFLLSLVVALHVALFTVGGTRYLLTNHGPQKALLYKYSGLSYRVQRFSRPGYGQIKTGNMVYPPRSLKCRPIDISKYLGCFMV